MSFLTAVFSFNRGQLLWNCVRSIERFSSATEIVVFDDLSDEPATRAVLEQLKGRGHEVISPEGTAADEIHGGLFANMNRALDLAGARGFRLLHLVQDDLQLVWRNVSLDEDVTRVLDASPQACQVQAHFWRRLGIAHATAVPEHRAYRLQSTGDIGFVDVGRLCAAGFRFQDSERGSAVHARTLGLESYALADPVVARVPWPMHARHRRMSGRQKGAGAEFVLKPLDAVAQSRLRTRTLGQLPYGEDFYVPWGWRCWTPYPISPSYVNWMKAIGTIAFHRRSISGLIPRRVGVSAERGGSGGGI